MKKFLVLAVIFLLALSVNAQRESEKDSLRINLGFMINSQAESLIRHSKGFETYTDLYAIASIGDYGFTLTPFYLFSSNSYGSYVDFEFKQLKAYTFFMLHNDELMVGFGISRKIFSTTELFIELNNSVKGLAFTTGVSVVFPLQIK